MDMNYLIQFLWLTIFLEHSCHAKCTTWWKCITLQRWQTFWKDLLLLAKYCRSFVRNIWSKSFVTLYWTRLYGGFSLTSIFMPLTFSFVSIEFAFLCVTQGTFGNFWSERHLEWTHLSFHSSYVKTRKSSCVNARGIPTAAYQVLHLLSCTRWGTPPVGVPPWPDPMEGYLRWGTLVRYPPKPGLTREVPKVGYGYLYPRWGTPIRVLHQPGPIGGTRGGVPPSLVWGGTQGGVPPLGYPPAGPGWGTPPAWTWPGYSPDRWENITFPSYYVRGR